jgi:hypothetical protein
METPDQNSNTWTGVFNMVTSLVVLGYIWTFLGPAANSMGMVLLLAFFFSPLMIYMFFTGIMTLINAKSAPIFQFFLCLMLFFFLFAGISGGWMSDAKSSARFGNWHDLIFLYSMILLCAIEIFFSILWTIKKK